jgi:MFS family permease
MLGCFLSGLIVGSFYATLPVFCHHIGLSIADLSIVMSVTILGGLLLQWPVGVLSDRFDRPYTLSGLCLAVAFISTALVFAADISLFLFLVVMILFGGLIFTIYPVSIARAHDLFDADDIVPASSVLLLCYCIGGTLGPVAASLTMAGMKNGSGFFLLRLCFAGICDHYFLPAQGRSNHDCGSKRSQSLCLHERDITGCNSYRSAY